MIQVKDLRAGYPTGFRRVWKEVLSGLSFDVPAGTITGYLGVNGAGKTTTIKVLVGINRPSGGEAAIGGHPCGTPDAQRLLGYFPEAPFFYDGLNGRELLDFYGRLAGMERDARRARAEALLEEVGLGEAKEVPVKGYSKGMRQRLGLAQALVADPQLLVLDEPLDGLDPMGRLHLRNLIERQREAGKTVFFSSHVLSDVEAVSDHLVVIDGGKVAYSGTTEGIAGDEQRVDVVVEAPESARAALSEAAGVPLEIRSPLGAGLGRYAALCESQAQADALVGAALAQEGRVLEFSRRRPNLEEVFLARFGGRPAAEGSPSAPAQESSEVSS